ncbi:MAG: SDR family NAD(P)-dependent oxidoreductase [Candidatus Dormibacteria bacterium]
MSQVPAGDPGSSRAALVTGGSRGMGRSTALALAARGYDVAINFSRSREAAELVAEAVTGEGRQALLLQADVSDEGAVTEMLAQVSERFGRLDALVNNAGTSVAGDASDLAGLGLEDWDRIFAVNVRGLFQVTRAAHPLLRRAHGCVVNMASIAGLRPTLQPLPYAASKAAVVSLTRTLARALAPEVRVNAVAPGWVQGEWMEQALGDDYQRLMARRGQHTPLGRVAQADDVAEAILALIESNRFVTGEVVTVDGGYRATT